jgi:N6-L-threonylcarbamoyladenine synthase
MCNIVGSMKTMGFESLANNIGIGMVREDGTILANLHHIYITPPSQEFLPPETMVHHH